MKIIVDMPNKKLQEAVENKIKKDTVQWEIEQLTDEELQILDHCIGELFEFLDLDQEAAVMLIKAELEKRKNVSDSSGKR